MDPEVARLLAEDRRYPLPAYQLLFESLQYAHKTLRMGAESDSEPLDPETDQDADSSPQQHVTGQELCEAVRLYAIEQYGCMARTVLCRLGIRSTGDIGEMVYNLIRIGRMRKTRRDRREDFDDVYDFADAFQDAFRMAARE